MRDPMVAALRKAKASGHSATNAWRIMKRGTEQAAKADNWRPSVRAMTMADRFQALVKVYGVRAANEADAALKTLPSQVSTEGNPQA